MTVDNFKRRATFLIGGARELNFPEFSLAFTTVFDSKPTPNTTEATIWNPSNATIQSVDRSGGAPIKMLISAGYETDKGQVVAGEIKTFSISREGTDRLLKIQLIDQIENWSSARVSRTFAGKNKASEMVNDFLNSFGLVADITLGEDVVLENRSFNTKLKNALIQLARETKSDFFMRDGRIIFRPKSSPGTTTIFQLSPISGLKGRPERETDGNVRAVSIFNYRLGSGDSIGLKSEEVDALFVIESGRHIFSPTQGDTELILKNV